MSLSIIARLKANQDRAKIAHQCRREAVERKAQSTHVTLPSILPIALAQLTEPLKNKFRNELTYSAVRTRDPPDNLTAEIPMAKEPKQLADLFHDTLKDIYFAEKKILASLPKMAKAAQNEQLSAAFKKHHSETEGQIERLEQVFEEIGEKPQGKTCAAIMGILDEGKEIMDEYKDSPALDAGLLAAAQAVEHYEICRYGTLCTWAEQLGHEQSVKLLGENLDEEETTDEALSELAESVVNQQAQAEAAE
jgi:ferritin-like metal-binding protein YciE